MRPFYVTTPIYYVNDRPHIGHAYSTVAADVLARFQRLRGRPTRFLTGLDEHGLKIERRAREEGMEPQQFVDRMAPPFRRAWEALNCSHDDFIRTTEARHERRVQALWKRLEAAGDIYLGDYEDWYCVGCETFYPERELADGRRCPVHKKPVERVKERSYFFRLSRYEKKLLDFYEAHPDFVQPEGRFNEVKAFVRGGLRDLSISRTSFHWGVPVPGDPEHVMYVWLDALSNYVTALGGPSDPGEAPLFDTFWPPSGQVVHIVGKDILRFHAVYWPAFLMSAGLEPPTQVWAHGWLTVDGEKMSKSLGNFLPPEPLAEAFGADVLRYYLMRDIVFGQDGDFSHRKLLARYHGELGNGLGNLLHRMVRSIVGRYLDGRVPHVTDDRLEPMDRDLVASARRLAATAAEQLDAVAPQRALDTIFELVANANRYIDRTEPWKLGKAGDRKRLEVVAYVVLEVLRFLSVMLWPFMPERCDVLRAQLGLPPLTPRQGVDLWPSSWGALPAGTEVAPGAPLFPRWDERKQREVLASLGVRDDEDKMTTNEGTKDARKNEQAREASSAEGIAHIVYDDFAKVQLRVGLITEASKVPKADRLLQLAVDLGEPEARTIVAGIAEHYTPEQLVGKRVVVVANLEPRKLRGILSQGMLLAASHEDRLCLLEVPCDLPPGASVS